jgi:hypothetical protein
MLVSVVLTALVSIALFAQSDTSQISGFVKDASGASVPNAAVTASNDDTGLTRKTNANNEGFFIFASLPPGMYTVTVEASGFKKSIRKENKLDAATPLSMTFSLDVGAVTESVEVIASVAQLQTENATVGRTVERKQIESLSLNGRNPMFLAQLKPGVRAGSLNGFSFGLTTGGFSINGGRSQDFLLTFDGAVGVRTRANGTSIGVADVETVQEMQVLTANFNAEYGRSASGQVRIVTRSGGQQFHGAVYEYYRNDALDSNTWARNRAGQLREKNRFNQFGYVINGPAFIPKAWNQDRTKLFFLWSQEWVKWRREQTAQTVVPTLLMRQGNFSELLGPNTFFTGVRNVNDPTTGSPFPGNIIPSNRLSPNGIGMLRAYPAPNLAVPIGRNNFFATGPAPQNQRKDTLSLDFLPIQNHTVRFRFSNYNFDALDSFRANTNRAPQFIDRPNQTASINHIWTVNSTTINEFLVAASVDRVKIFVDTSTGAYRRQQYGINYPYIFPERKEIFDKIPTIVIQDFGDVDGGPYPASSAGPIYQISNNTTKIIGTHQIKFGVAFERSGQNDFDQINVAGVPGGTNNQNGRFEYNNGRAAGTGIGIGNAALGLFTNYAEIGPRSYTPYRGHMIEWFIQDTWKATERLTLTYGVRHTLQQPYYYSLWGNIAVFDPRRYNVANTAVVDPATGFISAGDRFNGVVIPGTGWPDAARGRVPIADTGEFNRLFSGGSKTWGEFQPWNFAPRVGIAYKLGSRSVLRTGGGTFYQRPGVTDSVFLGGQNPFQPIVAIATGQADNPSGGRPSNFPLFYMSTDPVFKIPMSYQWNAGYQRELPGNMIAEFSYVGTRGKFLERERNLNQLRPGTFNPAVNVNAQRPYRGFAEIALQENAARSNYNAFQAELNKRFSKGFSYGFAYTFSKSMDNSSDRRSRIINAYDDTNMWGPSNFDTRHLVVANYVYELPFFRGKNLAGALLGGWQVNGVIQWQTGTPFSVGLGQDFALAGTGTQGQLLNYTGNATYPKQFSQGTGSGQFWFDGRGQFSNPTAGTYGNQTRNLFNNPGFSNWNTAALKDFRIGKSENPNTLQFRFELFNAGNIPQFSGVDSNPNSATFGMITQKGAVSPRNIQLSLRYGF